MIPIGQEEYDENQEVEILYLTNSVHEGNHIYEFEMHFMSDHQIFARAARDGTWGNYKCMTWRKLNRVREVAEKKEEEGWEVEWNPAWAPRLNEFIREVSF